MQKSINKLYAQYESLRRAIRAFDDLYDKRKGRNSEVYAAVDALEATAKELRRSIVALENMFAIYGYDEDESDPESESDDTGSESEEESESDESDTESESDDTESDDD